MKYRDTKTGRLVSKTTWKRSKSRGGKRYKRERPKPRRKRRPPLPPPPPPPTGIFEWLITFAYQGKRAKSLDIIATAEEEERAIEKAVNFASRNAKARRAMTALDRFSISAKRGRKVGHHHPTEWRADSRG